MHPELLGFIAAVLTTSAFVPQAWMTVRTRDTRSISLAMYIVFNIGIILWLAYGWSIASRPMIYSNIVTLALSTTILVVKWQNRALDREANARQPAVRVRPGLDSLLSADTRHGDGSAMKTAL